MHGMVYGELMSMDMYDYKEHDCFGKWFAFGIAIEIENDYELKVKLV